MACESDSNLFDFSGVLYKKYWRRGHEDPESGISKPVSMQSRIGFLGKTKEIKEQTNKK